MEEGEKERGRGGEDGWGQNGAKCKSMGSLTTGSSFLTLREFPYEVYGWKTPHWYGCSQSAASDSDHHSKLTDWLEIGSPPKLPKLAA
jgi:hypothetical protein